METFRAVRRVLWITMGLNLVATVAKLAVGYRTGSLSLIADGFDSVFDSASNVIGLVGVFMAARPADSEHPYGHRKAETLSALTIAMLLFLTTWELVKSAIGRLQDPSLIEAEVNVWSFGALLVSIAVHILVVWYELRAGRRLKSEILVADAMHTRADIFVSLAVVGGLIAVGLGYPIADPILALVVALFIAKIGIDIIRESSPTLMDRVVVSPDAVKRVVESVPGVISSHRVRSRGHERAVYADLHIQVDPTLQTDQAHAIAHQVQRRLREHLPELEDVTIHVEPGRSGDVPSLQRQADVVVQEAASRLPGVVRCGRVTVSLVDGRYLLSCTCEVDGGISVKEADRVAGELEVAVRRELPQVQQMVVRVEPADRRENA